MDASTQFPNGGESVWRLGLLCLSRAPQNSNFLPLMATLTESTLVAAAQIDPENTHAAIKKLRIR
jgi:hypothetical protein